jgi:hypothetical protein
MKTRIVLAIIAETTIAITAPLERLDPIASPPWTVAAEVVGNEVAAEVVGNEVALAVPDITEVLSVVDASF